VVHPPRCSSTTFEGQTAAGHLKTEKFKPAAGRVKAKILNGPLDTENVKAK